MGEERLKFGIGNSSRTRSGGSRPHISSGQPLPSLHSDFGVCHYVTLLSDILKPPVHCLLNGASWITIKMNYPAAIFEDYNIPAG